MEFINVKNKDGVTIINDTYDNLVYLRFPVQKEAELYTGPTRAVTASLVIPAQPKTYTPMMYPVAIPRYGVGGTNAIRVYYITQKQYHGDAPLIAVTVPQGYEFTAQWYYNQRQKLLVLIVDVVRNGEKITQAMINEVKAGIKFYCFGQFEDVVANKNTPRVRFVDKVGSSKPNVALQVLGRHKFFKEDWIAQYNIQNDVIYDSRIRYLRIIDSYTKDWYESLWNYTPETFTSMARDPKSYGRKIAVIPLSVIDAAVWGPNINNGDKKARTGTVWQTFKFHDDQTLSVKSYQQIYWNVFTTYPAGCAGSSATQYLVVDVTGYDKSGGIPFN